MSIARLVYHAGGYQQSVRRCTGGTAQELLPPLEFLSRAFDRTDTFYWGDHIHPRVPCMYFWPHLLQALPGYPPLHAPSSRLV